MKLNSLQLYSLWHNGPELQFRMEFAMDVAFSRSYYRKLRSAIYEEAVTSGSCCILDELITSSQPTWDLIVFHAILDVAQCLLAKRDLAEPDRFALDTIDGSRYAWRSLGPDARLNLTPERQYYMSLIYWFFQRVKQSGPSRCDGSAGEAARILSDARAEADRILANANKTRDDLLRDAHNQAELIENAALEKAANTELNAQRKAQDILMDARQNADECYEQAYEDAKEKAMERLEAEAAEESQRLIRQNLTGFMTAQRQQWLDAQAETEQLRERFAGETAALKEQVCQQTTAAGADISRTLEDAVNALTALKNGFFTGLQDWRSSLYKAEYGPLINCYNNLLMLISGFDRDVAAEQQRRGGELSGTELTTLQQHSSRMEKFRMNMERAMLSMGLRVFRPAEGELFDSYAHATDDGEDDDTYNGCAIVRCVRPGIIRSVNSANEEVLHRATVTIRRPGDGFDPQYNG